MLFMADSVLHNKEDAEDVVHDTFIKIARNIKSIGEPNSAEALSYVLKATKNTAINLLNKNKNHSTVNIDDIDKISDEDFLDKLNISNEYKKVVDAICKLEDKYKDVMFYHFVQEMKVNEIADLLGIKKSTVKQQLVRGKKLLLQTINTESECFI
jgi:RNA polymerase sigma-70 factor (ECF subfamily)